MQISLRGYMICPTSTSSTFRQPIEKSSPWNQAPAAPNFSSAADELELVDQAAAAELH